eukprot:TRINITY_DN34939_c0_g1_i1.p1 TRINITY_DN34939_c0_g1~~TRINITY_DN34939_c0_g1_i1.p1  ORF type:complete len:623 (-),score=113.20 TRINITY_DN34939_c0_g1_i1:591-2459(-)
MASLRPCHVVGRWRTGRRVWQGSHAFVRCCSSSTAAVAGHRQRARLAHEAAADKQASSSWLAAAGATLGGIAALSWAAWRWAWRDEEFDFVIVGAGSAGCALAARLKEALPHKKILLLEAGRDDDVPEIQTAVDYMGKVESVFTSERDWNHGTESQPGLNGRGLYWPRGKVVGGCSSFNTMVWLRPDPADMEEWGRAMNDPAWSYSGMLPYFRRAETHPLSKSRPDIHGADGPIAVARLDHAQHSSAAHAVTHAFVDASAALGHPKNEDFGAGLRGVGVNDVNAHGGRRCSAAAYLRHVGACPGKGELRARSGNLEVRLLQHVTRLVFDENKTAVGLEICDDAHKDGVRRRIIRARSEIVLCGGAVNSPHLLMLSGVGPSGHLKEMGVPVVADVPGVGQRLQDHLHIAMSYRLKAGLKPHPQSNICEGSLFTRLAPGDGPVDLQVHLGTVFFEPDGFYPSGEGFTLTPTLVHTKTSGSLQLRSMDPFDSPVINPNYLVDGADVKQLRDGLRMCRQIGNAILQHFEGEEVYPGAAVQSDVQIDEYLRKFTNTVYHPACSCRAGPASDPLAVLDSELRVRGVAGLRVADASAMPVHVRCNTNATCVALGEKAADLLAKQYAPPN